MLTLKKRSCFSFIQSINYVIIILLVTQTVIISSFEFEKGKCDSGFESFILATNVKLNTKPYKLSKSLNVTECVNLCQSDVKCKSFTFERNANLTTCVFLNTTANSKNIQKSVQTRADSGFYYMEKICLQSYCSRLFIMEWIKGASIEGHDDRNVYNITRDQCISHCLNETEFVCRSLEYNSRSKECSLSRYDRYSRPNIFKKNQDHISYFDNNCAYHPVDGGIVAEILLLGNVQHSFILSEYFGLSISECGDMCLKNALYPCRSFLFGRKSGLAYCGLTHQNRAVLVNNPNSFESSKTLNYYEIARSVEGCDTSDVHFELLSGSLLTTTSYKIIRDLEPSDCLELCRQDTHCRSLNIDYKKGTCSFSGQNLRTSGVDRHLKSSSYFNYFEKTCLYSNTNCHRNWAFERVKGKELVGMIDEKVLVEASTREECETACLEYTEFVCRSAEFNYQMNECRLSPYNRFSSRDKIVKLESSRSLVDYLENNCAHEAKQFCNWKTAKQHRLILADKILLTSSVQKCEKECTKNTHFICRSFSYDSNTGTCSLSHHGRRSTPQGALVESSSNVFYEIASCFDVAIDCEPNFMRARVLSNTLFQGKVYTRERPSSCFLDVDRGMNFSLPIYLTGDQCGTKIEKEGQFTNVLVIQNNDHVVTAFDKAIGVRCSYNVGNITGETALKIREMKLPRDYARSSGQFPNVSLHITDVKGLDKEVANLGELLKIQVRMDNEDTYGIFLRNLIAKDTASSNNLTLIDEFGCPVEAKMMREVRTISQNSKSLESFFEAFSFTGSNSMELEADVETCLDRCRPAQCQLASGRSEEDYETVISFGRKKRSIDDARRGDIVEIKKVHKTLSIVDNEFKIGLDKGQTNFKSESNFKDKIEKSVKVEQVHSRPAEFKNKLNLDYLAQELNFYCFAPDTLATFSGITLMFEFMLFVFTLLISYRQKRKQQLSKQAFISIY